MSSQCGLVQVRPMCASIFVAEQEYTCKGVGLWGIFAAHRTIVKDSSRSLQERVFHGILAVFEFLPVLGHLVSAVEYVMFKILNPFCQNKQEIGSIKWEKQRFQTNLQWFKEERIKATPFDFSKGCKQLCEMQEICNEIEPQNMLQDLKDAYAIMIECNLKEMYDCVIQNKPFPTLPLQLPASKGDETGEFYLKYRRPNHHELLTLAKEIKNQFSQYEVGFILERNTKINDNWSYYSEIVLRKKNLTSEENMIVQLNKIAGRIQEVCTLADCKSVVYKPMQEANDCIAISFEYFEYMPK